MSITMGFYHAIQWIHNLHLTNVDFEVDSKKVADFFNIGTGISVNLTLSWIVPYNIVILI
jgi:hypothetical protein